MKTGYKALLFLAPVLAAFSVCAAEKAEPPQEYAVWLEELKREMIGRGISKATIKKVYKNKNYYHADPEVVKIDRRQNEFVLTPTDYLNRVVDKSRVETAQQKYKELYPLFRDMEKKYGVPIHYLIAFWAVETNFGRNFGSYNVIDALTTLSYDRRRPKFFREELYQALKIIDDWQINPEKMEGSWAGAMGHFQFMPSTFNAYAVDYNGDGQIDIWHSFEDAIASAANYLSDIGWRKNEPWGMEVSLSWNFDYSLTGRGTVRTVKQWRKAGVRTLDNKRIDLESSLPASIIVPEGKKGSAFMILTNFRKIMNWNRSENYALAISLLADYIKSGKKWKPFRQNPAARVKTDDIMKIQSFINRLGWFKLDEDGQLGNKTREAIKKVQAEAKMPQDGYPDYQLLQKINNYDPQKGFAIPVPERKLHK